MPRGRACVPSTERDGIWFRHAVHDPLPSITRTDGTSTGRMLTCALQPNPRTAPIPAPFQTRATRNFKRSNGFSNHDNRHVFQDCGEYFEDGKDQRILGKRLITVTSRQHSTPKDMLKHCDRSVVDYDYRTTYTAAHDGTATREGPRHRRFPKQHSSESGPAKPANTISDWFPHANEPIKIPLQVLASSQEPFPRHNAWKYSKNSVDRIYPSYRVSEVVPQPVFNKYGANFISGTT